MDLGHFAGFLSHKGRLYLVCLPLCFGCAAKKADLTPIPSGGQADLVSLCQVDPSGYLTITVTNLGQATSKATSTRIEFVGSPAVSLPTRPIAPAGTTTLRYPLPPRCFMPDCQFTIRVDVKGEVEESDEENNQIQGRCPRSDSSAAL